MSLAVREAHGNDESQRFTNPEGVKFGLAPSGYRRGSTRSGSIGNLSLDKSKRIAYGTSLRGAVLMTSRQHSQQDSGFRSQEQLWERASRHGKRGEATAFAQTKTRVLCRR